MSKQDKSTNNRKIGKSDKPNQASNSQPATQAILKTKAAKPSGNKIKVSFKDKDGDAIKEEVYTYEDGEQKEVLLILEKQLLQLGVRYSLFEEGKWKKLCRIGARALSGECAEVWNSKVENGIRNHATGNSTAQKKKFEEAIQVFNETYLGEDAIEDQRSAFEEGKL